MIYQLDSLFLKKGLCIGFYITYKAMVYTYIKLPGKLKKKQEIYLTSYKRAWFRLES